MAALKPKYRFEILLPKFYNDGTPIEAEKIESLLEELSARIGAYRHQASAPFEGLWTEHKPGTPPTIYRDLAILLVVDTDRDPAVIDWFADFKAHLAELLQQIEIYVTMTEIFWL